MIKFVVKVNRQVLEDYRLRGNDGLTCEVIITGFPIGVENDSGFVFLSSPSGVYLR